MLLRRITKHVKNQNWFAVALDFVIVVVGILIAFQITEWNEARVNKNRAHDYLIRLQSEFEAFENRLTGNIEEFDESLDAITQTRFFLKNQDLISKREEQKFLTLLNNIDAISIPAWRSGTYVEMQSAGVLDLIQSTELKQSLIQYDQTTEIAQKGFEVLAAGTVYVRPTLTSLIEYGINVETSFGTDSINAIAFDFERMKLEPEFKSALSELARSQSNHRILQANQLRVTRKVLKALSEELN